MGAPETRFAAGSQLAGDVGAKRYARVAPEKGADKEALVIEEGTEAPDFELTSDDGSAVRLSDLRGQPVVLYFYPKDETPGCTAQALGIRDAWAEFQRHGATVLGVSPDDERSHARFRAKHGLPFTLLADTEHEVSELYGVWGERKFRGRTYMGVERSTFVIDEDGTVVRALYGVKPDGHAELVLDALPDGS
jgi:thioredoxin-dependent peroxiredoxin